MSGLYYDRYAHMGPDSSPRALAAKATLAAIHSEFDLVCEIRPAHPWQAYGFHNPVVRVYRVTPGSANAPPPPAEVGELDTNSVSQNTLSTF
jgi:hypothetical protein